jgi:DNA-binding transcriptional regulator WhiA
MENDILEKVIELRKLDNGITTIARKLNKCTETIREYLVYLKELPEKPKLKGGRKRKYNVDDNFFECIDNEEKAYILGFIFADGCVHKRNQFSICLNSKDENLLVKINEIMKSNFPIKREMSRYSEQYKYTEKSRFVITSGKLISDLEKYGCVQKKSDILKFPNINNENINHFMRGYFDGDGTVFITKNNEIRMGIISTKEFCESYLKRLPYKGKAKVRKEYRSNKNVYYFSIGGKTQVKDIYNFLYDNATVYLERKKEIFDIHYKQKLFNIIY